MILYTVILWGSFVSEIYHQKVNFFSELHDATFEFIHFFEFWVYNPQLNFLETFNKLNGTMQP